MIRHFTVSLLLILLVAKGFGEGRQSGGYYKYSGYSNCCSPDCCFEIGAEWLYMLPAYDQPYFSINNGTGSAVGPTFFNGERIANEQTWHSGARLDLFYYLPNRVDHLRLRGTYFPGFSDSRSDNEFSAAILNFPLGGIVDDASFSSIKDHFNFYYVELLFGRTVYCSRPVTLGLDVGIEFTRLDLKESVEYLNPAALRQIEYRSKLKGVGPELSFDFSYQFLQSLSVNGRATSALIVSKRDASAEQRNLTTGITTASTKNESYWRSSPIIDFRLGLNYHRKFKLSCRKAFYMTAELGYEVIHYFKSADRIYFVDDLNNGSSFDQNMDFTMHGPYLHLGICF